MERRRIVLPKRGRPRSSVAHAATLDAAIALVRELGYDAVTIEGIADRAGVGKATVYRWWRSKELLVVEALERIIVRMPVPDTGTTRNDLLAMTEQTGALYDDPATASLLSGLVAAMVRSPAIARAVRVGLVLPRRAALESVLKRGMERGEVRRKIDLDLAVDMLSGPLFYRALLTGRAMDRKFLRGVAKVMFRGIAR